MDKINRSALLVIHHYNRYANQLVLDTAAKMEEEAFTAQSSPSHGSVQELLTHMLSVEFFFLARSEGKPINPKAIPDKALSLSEITTTFAQISDEREKYLNWVTDEKLEEVIEIPIGGKAFKLPRWQLLAQSLFSSVHHRGELSIVMTGLGFPLPTLDPIIQFVNESGQEWHLK
jgi:uncharacterized damage-inducible protein DinB